MRLYGIVYRNDGVQQADDWVCIATDDAPVE
jgi:hypothetical protein